MKISNLLVAAVYLFTTQSWSQETQVQSDQVAKSSTKRSSSALFHNNLNILTKALKNSNKAIIIKHSDDSGEQIRADEMADKVMQDCRDGDVSPESQGLPQNRAFQMGIGTGQEKLLVTCYKKVANSDAMEEVSYLAEVSDSGRLNEFEMISAQTHASAKNYWVETAEVVATISVAVLVSGALAYKAIYKNEVDKAKHAVYGSVTGAIAAEIAYKIFHLSKNQSLIAGALVGCIVGWAKEKYYDKRRRDRHTVDRNDFYSTCNGAVLGAGGVRLQWTWSW